MPEPDHRPGTDEGAQAWRIAVATAEGWCYGCARRTDRRWEFSEAPPARDEPRGLDFPVDTRPYIRHEYACCGRDACSELLIRAEAQRALPHQHPTYWP